MEHIQTLRRRASEEKEKKKKKQPPSPPRGTPVDSLPNELLSYIFTLGSEAEEDDDDDDDDEDEEEEDEYGVAIRRRRPLRRLPFKVLVSHICRRWRTVVIETSTLWTHLNFAEGPPFAKSRTWLERSKECVLDIELDCTVDDDDDDEEEEEVEVDSDESDDLPDASSNDVVERVAPEEGRDAQSGDLTAPVKTKARRFPGRVSPVSLPIVRDLILPHAWRWRIFELMVNDYQIMYGILSTLSSIPEATQLQVLRLYHYDDDDDDEYDRFRPAHLRQPFFAPFCGRAPNLVQLALWGVHVDWTACADLLLQGLEELELAYHAKDVRPPYAIFARTLQRSPDLHILTLCASGPAGDPEDWPADVIELPSVKHLVLAFVEPPYASALMKRLVFPNLSTLALDFDAGDYSSFLAQLARPPPPPPAHHLTTTQRHALCHTLVDLKISGMQCTEAALAAFYAALGNLASLNLNCYHLPRHFFQLLFPHVRNDSDSDDKNSNDDSDSDGQQRRRQHEGCYLPKLETLSTSGIDGAEICDLLRRRVEVPLKHVFMDSAADVDIDEETWIRGSVETFDFFDGSDDEDDDDDDDPIITELVDEQEMEMGGAAFAAEGDGMPEWVDEDEPMP
jgi:hypothetical protein